MTSAHFEHIHTDVYYIDIYKKVKITLSPPSRDYHSNILVILGSSTPGSHYLCVHKPRVEGDTLIPRGPNTYTAFL